MSCSHCFSVPCSLADPWLQAGAKRLEREILFSSSPLGNAVQRMGLLFLRGLKLRAAVGSSAMSNAELNQRLADAAPRITQVRTPEHMRPHCRTMCALTQGHHCS